MLPPQPAIPPPYCFLQNTGKLEITEKESVETAGDFIQSKQPRSYVSGKMGTDIALDKGASSFYLPGGPKADVVNRTPVEANLLPKSPFHGISTGGAAHRKVSVGQFGMSRMY